MVFSPKELAYTTFVALLFLKNTLTYSYSRKNNIIQTPNVQKKKRILDDISHM